MLTERQNEFLKWNVYQIYPRSFYDSNSDGIGDLRGIIQKVDYLKELGINAVWLCPCFKSPNIDNGYDVADYRDIMDEFGTMEDMKQLIEVFHNNGIKIILDLVPNHTSNMNKWFQESRKSKDNPYSNYYIWADEPLNNWTASFGGSAWQYDDLRGQYYLHSYAVEQPDLNWDEPKVREEIKAVIDFWVGLGVDGFRIDVIDQISKDFERGWAAFGPHLHEYIHELFGREHLSKIFTVGECWASSETEMVNHAGKDRGELVTLFQFDHMNCGRSDKYTKKEDSLKSLMDIVTWWDSVSIRNDLVHVLFTDNHDQPQLLSRIGNDGELRYESATCIATMLYTLKGVPFIYQGQELGMPTPYYDSIDCFDDIESINAYKELSEKHDRETVMKMVNFGSRDNNRRPMAWDDSEFGGFSKQKPWIALHSKQKEINYKNDICAEKSVFNYYKALLKLRTSNDALLYGDVEILSKSSDGYLITLRTYEDKKILAISNFENESKIDIEMSGKALLANLGRVEISGIYKPYETAIFAI